MLEPGDEFEFADVLDAVRLPELPVVVAPQEFSVPVARWVGLGLAAVRFVEGIQYDDGYVVNDEVALLHRRDEQWCEDAAGGGTNWYFDDGVILRRPPIAERAATLSADFRSTSNEGEWAVLSGEAGAAARWVELEQSRRVLRRSLESPIGVFVLAMKLDVPAEVRVLDGTGSVLMRSRSSDW